MNAVRLEIGWKDEDAANVTLSKRPADGGVGMSPNPSRLERSISSARVPGRCLHCDSIVYSRRSEHCGVCGEPLPPELLFSPEEARRIKQLLSKERERHKKWMRRSLDQPVGVSYV